jgi:hypothetical protein
MQEVCFLALVCRVHMQRVFSFRRCVVMLAEGPRSRMVRMPAAVLTVALLAALLCGAAAQPASCPASCDLPQCPCYQA